MPEGMSEGSEGMDRCRSHLPCLLREMLRCACCAPAQVKALFKAKFGEDVDDEDDEHIPWIASRGAAPSTEHLEDRLSEVMLILFCS